jgi:hypothetical protein
VTSSKSGLTLVPARITWVTTPTMVSQDFLVYCTTALWSPVKRYNSNVSAIMCIYYHVWIKNVFS